MVPPIKLVDCLFFSSAALEELFREEVPLLEREEDLPVVFLVAIKLQVPFQRKIGFHSVFHHF